MNYKIDTKENFDVITPEISQLDSLSEQELKNCCRTILNNDKSAILEMKKVRAFSDQFGRVLHEIHDEYYGKHLSFAICNLNPQIKNLKTIDSDALNIVPTLIEAIDLISMEGLEREILGEDF